MEEDASAPSVNVKVAITLLQFFLVGIVIALLVTLVSVSPGTQLVAVAAVLPVIVLSLIFIYYCRKGKAWSFAGASILGAFGVALRVIISLQPSLEVGGGLPVGVTVLYIVLGAMVSLKNYEAYLELRTRSSSKESSGLGAYAQFIKKYNNHNESNAALYSVI